MVALPRSRPADADTWSVRTVQRLDRDSLRALLDNRVSAIRRPGLLDPRTCAESITKLQSCDGWDTYDVNGPPTGKLGISQYAYGQRKKEYFTEAATALEQRARILESMPDPLQLVHDELAQAWQAPVAFAEEEEGRYFAGVFRSGAGIRPHADWGPRDGPGWVIENVVAQLAWNMYYAAPEVGGNLIVYDRAWTPDLEVDARQQFYDYNPEKLAGCPRVEISLQPGDLVMFTSSNVHAVAEAPSGATRLAASSFIGECPDGSLLLWS
jgi:hypothetical protein